MKYIPRAEKKNELEKLTTAAMIGLGGAAAPPAGAGVGAAPPGGGGVVGSSPLALSPPSCVSASSSAKQVRSRIMSGYNLFAFLSFLLLFHFISTSFLFALYKPQMAMLLPSGIINSVSSSSPSSCFSRSS